LNAALNNYFSSKNGFRKGPKVGFPKFKSKKTQCQSFRLNNDRIHTKGNYIYIPRLGLVNMTEILRFRGKIMGVIILLRAGHWYALIRVEVEQPEQCEFAESIVGIDLGVKTLMVLSNGKQYENQALLRSNLTHLKRLNRRLTRRVIGSHRWFKAKEQLSNYYAKITNQRMDYLHKATTNIASTYAVIGLESLNVAGLMKNHKLALSLSDASFGEIRRQLIYKSKWFGGQVVLIDRFFPSSRRCSNCGYINKTLTLKERIWICPICAKTHDRDFNAAINIAIEAQRILELTPVVATSGIRLADGM
jgi:putative transposase